MKVRVISAFYIGSTLHAVGDEVDVSDDDAAGFVGMNKAELVDPPPPPETLDVDPQLRTTVSEGEGSEA